MMLHFVLLSAALAAAQAPSSGPTGAPGVTLLKERFLAATLDDERSKALADIARTPPISARDVSALFDLFSRFPDPGLRRAVMDSLALIPSGSPQLEPLFIDYLRQPEPEAQVFGINGAFRLRAPKALPMIRKIAERRFSAADASAITVLSERNAWWAQYEALSALAQWEGEKALPLLRRKADESPAVAGLLGRYFWRRIFPDIETWARAEGAPARQRAIEAAGVPIDPADARATREAMLALVRDSRIDEELRHRLALKAGACSTDAEVEALIEEHDKAADAKMRLLLAAAVSLSRSPKAVPLLARYAKDAPDEVMRRGARAQLVDMLGEDETRALLERPADTGPRDASKSASE